MNKKLLMTAIGVALAAGPMLTAQAVDTAVYGSLHMSSDSIDNGSAKSGFIASNSSRFGIKGSDDLGGGLKAIYQMESGAFAMDTGTSGLGGALRNTYLGFAGSSWGAVKFGRYDTPFKELGLKANLFIEQVGDARNILSGSGASASALDARVSNMIRYESPSMGGVTVNVLHTSNNGVEGPAGPTTSNSVNSFSVNWAAGPAFVGVAYQKDGFQKSATITRQHDSNWRAVGAYSFGDLMVGLAYEDVKDIGGTDQSQKGKGLIASYKIANNTVKFEYLKADDVKGTGATSSSGANMTAIGVDHSFSKATMAYVNYATAKNDSKTKSYSVISTNGGHGEDDLPSVNGKTVKGISGGMILKF